MRWLVPTVLLAGGALLRLAWIFAPGGGLDGDEAVFGLMALHILDGRDYPIFCWGAHYAGAVVSYIAAAGYQIFGISGAVLKSATLPFAVGYLAVTYGLARIVFDDRTARIALLLAAIPPALPLDFSVKATGGYPETLCFGGLVLLLAFRLPGEEPSPGALRWHLLLLGFVGGFGLYILPLVLPYLAVACGFLAGRRGRLLRGGGWVWLLAGGLMGVSPLIIYNLAFPLATFLRLGSRVLVVSKSEALVPGAGLGTAAAWIVQYLLRLPTLVPGLLQNLGPLMGLRFPGGSVLAFGLLVAAGVSLWRMSGRGITFDLKEPLGRWLAMLIPSMLLFVWVAGLNRPRHLVPLYSVIPLGLAASLRAINTIRPWIAQFALVVLLFAAGWDLVWTTPGPAVTPVEPLLRHLQQMEIRGVYADYTTAYQLMFLTHEKILASPSAWSEGVISDRTPEITRQVDRLSDPAYVFPRNSPEALWFGRGLERRRVVYASHQVGSFEVFTDLTQPIRSAAFPVRLGW